MPPENNPSTNVDYSQISGLMESNPAYQGNYDAGAAFDWLASKTGGLTSADMARMNEERYRDTLAFKREFLSSLFLDSTEMQRKVADYKAAGINPYALAGQSVSPPSVSASASGVSTGRGASGNLSELFQPLAMLSQIRLNESQAKKNEADAKKTETETEGAELSNILFRDTMEIKKVLLGDEHDAYQWKKDVAQREVGAKETANTILQQQADAYTAQVDSMMSLVEEQKLTEQVKRQELRALAREANANADYKAAMQALDAAIKTSQNEVLQEDLKIAAAEARFKNGIYTDEYIKAIGEAAGAEADMKQCLAEYNRGDYHAASKSMQKMFKEMEKQKQRGTWSVGSPYFSASESAPK